MSIDPASPVAAIDCGTNSTRLLVLDVDASPLLRRMEITRLGEGVDDSRNLDSAAIDRVVKVLRSFKADIDQLDVGAIRLIATSAVRDAQNKNRFLESAAEAIGVAPDVITGEQEGRLAFAGSAAGLPPVAEQRMVIDIGGGSTELVIGHEKSTAAVSLDIGCVRITERFLKDDPPRADDVTRAARFIREQLQHIRSSVPAFHHLAPSSELVGLAGSVSTLVMLEQSLDIYDRDRVHGFTLTFEAVTSWTDLLLREAAGDRVRHPGMDPRRKEVIIGGILILREAMAEFGFRTCIESESDLLDGVALELLSDRHSSVERPGLPGHR